MRFEVTARCGRARRARLELLHGAVETPVFMPVGSNATVKALSPNDLSGLGAQIILGNAYHLYLRPGTQIIRDQGGLHRFMGWDRPILTDSGGFQVFSLASLRRIGQRGVEFSSHIDGSRHFIGPEESVSIQHALGSDVVMCFDECPPYPSPREYILGAVDRTVDWARICAEKHAGNPNALFGIIQGGMFLDIRRECIEKLVQIGFDGYAIGGLSVGEPPALMYEMFDGITGWMPENKPRYVMGCGTPVDILNAVAAGVDMFDCVLPTRNARNGTAFTGTGPLTVRNARFKNDSLPVEEGCGCYCCRNFGRAYLRHLFNAGEILGPMLLTYHNIFFYTRMMEQARLSIGRGEFDSWKQAFLSRYGSNPDA